jgi:hypothetical protein
LGDKSQLCHAALLAYQIGTQQHLLPLIFFTVTQNGKNKPNFKTFLP